jgi:signal transduction histidine kinase
MGMRSHSRDRSHRRERRLVIAIAVSFGLAILSFLVSRTVTEIQSRRIQKQANSISQNALVATEALVDIRTSLRKIVFAPHMLHAIVSPDVAAQLGRELAVYRDGLAASWAKYLAEPFYPGERELSDRAQADLLRVELALDQVVERLRHGDREGALRVLDTSVSPAIAKCDDSVRALVELNRREAQDAAMRITASTRPGGFVPELVGMFSAVVVACLGVRVLVRYLAWSRERSAELEQFAGRVAHDLRSPLGAASIGLEIAQRSKDIDQRTRELLGRVTRTMQRVGRLVDDLLVFATSGGYFVPGARPEANAGVREVLDGVLDDMSFEADRKHIQLDYESPDPALAVACGPGVLISITTNLVTNAMKFMGDAPLRRVTVRAREVGRYVRIDVSDTGPGMAPELRERAFDPYVRGKSTASGFGLGLATVRRLVEAHGGDVDVETSPEGGCRFRVLLPRWTGSTR